MSDERFAFRSFEIAHPRDPFRILLQLLIGGRASRAMALRLFDLAG